MAKKCGWCGSQMKGGNILDSLVRDTYYCSKKCKHEAEQAR